MDNFFIFFEFCSIHKYVQDNIKMQPYSFLFVACIFSNMTSISGIIIGDQSGAVSQLQ